MGVEGGHIIEDEPARSLRSFYRLGVRYLTLTHSFHTELGRLVGDAVETPEPVHGGLAPFADETSWSAK